MNACEKFWGPGHDWTPWELTEQKIVFPKAPSLPSVDVLRQLRRCKTCGLYEMRRIEGAE